MRRLWPDRMGSRFALLLAMALVAANLVAFAVLSIERDRIDRTARIEREVERVASLVPALEAVAPERREVIARRASTRLTRLAVEADPRMMASGLDRRSKRLADALVAALPGRDVRAVVASDPGRREPLVVVSIALAGAGQDRSWLNLVVRARPGGPPPVREGLFAFVLVLSLAAVLGAALLASRQMTRPLVALAQAARAAGNGDRAARAPETGPRELRAAAAAFNDMQTRIARFDAERTRTLAAIGHDLRTPITSLRLRAEILAEDDPAGAEGEAAAMVRTLDDLGVMADGLVAYARGQGEAEATQDVALHDLLGRLCRERGAALAVAVPITLRARPVALARAAGNLIDNALRYAGAAEVSLGVDGLDAVIAVEDEGPGIVPERLTDMLEPFVRGEASRGTETGGAGLGLSVARTVAQAHGGRLILSNRPRGGLRAEIRLPVQGDLPLGDHIGEAALGTA